MLKCVVILSVVAFVAARPGKVERCCAPEQWEGTVGVNVAYDKIGGRPGMAEAYLPKVSIDDRNGRFALVEYIFEEGKEERIAVIGDVSKNALYTIHERDRKCERKPFKKMHRSCIPSTAEYVGTVRLGVHSPSELLENWYERRPLGPHGEEFSAFFVEQHSCIPVLEYTVEGEGNERAVSTTLFFNVTLGIRDPRVFTPPSYCDQSAWTNGALQTDVVKALTRKFINF